MSRSESRSSATEPTRAGRRPEIDWLKGFAILSVLAIHAKPLDGTLIYDHVINRAVPIFVVLFGMTSELWWRTHGNATVRATLFRWYASRLRRLMIPVWGALLLWWPLVTIVRDEMSFAPRFVVATFLGYMPWVGTGWFVTLILELVVLFPVIRLAVVRLGVGPSIAAAAVIAVTAQLSLFTCIALMRSLLLNSAPGEGFYYMSIFAPAWFFAVTCGIALARRNLQSSRRAAALCAAAVILCIWGEQVGLLHGLVLNAVHALGDPALTCLMLMAIPSVAALPRAAKLLTWLGVWSWGLYLGQLLVHNAFTTFHLAPYASTTPVRWAYFGCLLVGAVGLVRIGEGVRKLGASLIARDAPRVFHEVH